MSIVDVPYDLRVIARKYNIAVYDDNECKRMGCYPSVNTAASNGTEIYMGTFDDVRCMTAAFFHELGHTQASKMFHMTNTWLCKISCESVAWEVGRQLAEEHGFHWERDGVELDYARKQLMTYKVSHAGPDPDSAWK